jgi:hypothetical protein
MAQIATEGPLELLVLTHVDGDHVEGTILLVNDAAVGVDIREVWYNGPPQLTRELGPVQGEILGSLLACRAIPWNARFDGRAVFADANAPLPMRELPGGLRLTVLAPSLVALSKLRDVWDQACREAGLAFGSVEDALAALRARPALAPEHAYLSGPPSIDIRELARTRLGTDTSVTNASSIVLLAEYGDTRILLAGDATPDSLGLAVRRLLAERAIDRLPLTAFKVPHHGSAKNITADLVRLLPAEHYLFSTDGSYYKHPDAAAVATVVEHGPPDANLVFNYATARSLMWDNDNLRGRYGYRLSYPEPGSHGARVVLKSP